MNKLMQAKEQEKKYLEELVDRWARRNKNLFVSEDALRTGKADMKRLLGIDPTRLTKERYHGS